MKELYMIIDRDQLKVVQLGELETICEKQFLENPEATIYTAPVAYNTSYTVFTEKELPVILKNEGITEGTDNGNYLSCINILRLHLKDRYLKEKEQGVNKDLGYYKSELAKAMKKDPEYWAKFMPTPTEVPEGLKPRNTANKTLATGGKPSKPRTAGATGKVWEIADKIKDENTTLDMKALRPLIIAACVEAEINPATASTQYSKWKASKA